MAGVARGTWHVSKFSLEGLKKVPEVIPLLVIVGGWSVCFAGFVAWMCNTRDVQWNKKRRPINERMDLLKPWPLKLRVVEHGPKPTPVLYEIYKTMDEEHTRRAKDAEDERKLSKKKPRKN